MVSAAYGLRKGISKERHKWRFLRLESFVRLVSREEKVTLLFYKGYREQLPLIVLSAH